MKDKPYNKIINCARTPEPAVRTEKMIQMKKESSDKKMKLLKNDSRLLSSDKKSNQKDNGKKEDEIAIKQSQMVDNKFNNN